MKFRSRSRIRREKIEAIGLSVISIDSQNEGPTVVVTANIHGDELTGVAVVHALLEKLPKLMIAGCVHLYPSLNPRGLVAGTRFVPGINTDPNRVFPGSSHGTMLERHVWHIWRDIEEKKPDVLIDLHTDSGLAIPYALVDRVIRGHQRERLATSSLAIARATGLTVIHEYPDSIYIKSRLDRSLSGSVLNNMAVSTVTLEVGPCRYVEPASVQVALSATLGALTATGMVSAASSPHTTQISNGPWRRASGPTITKAGLLKPHKSPGDAFTVGDRLGVVASIDGQVLQELEANQQGWVLGWPEKGWVVPGSRSVTIAVGDV